MLTLEKGIVNFHAFVTLSLAGCNSKCRSCTCFKCAYIFLPTKFLIECVFQTLSCSLLYYFTNSNPHIVMLSLSQLSQNQNGRPGNFLFFIFFAGVTDITMAVGKLGVLDVCTRLLHNVNFLVVSFFYPSSMLLCQLSWVKWVVIVTVFLNN